jgi:NAD(P)-dependent dehydrogenase (short-subunit alcohol dehydrogenase family)
MDRIEDRVAVITGAASGIGFCTAAALARKGAKVVMADVNADLLAESVGKLEAEGLAVKGVQTDVSSFESMQNLASEAYAAFGKVNIVHLNAGISASCSFFDDDTQPWDRIVGINLLGVVWGIKAFLSRMNDSGEEGLILATSSGAGTEGTNYMAYAYAATKSAVLSLMESLHGVLRDTKSKVRSGVVFPPLTATRLAGDPAVMKFVEDQLQASGVPAALVQPEQVAEMIVDGIEKGRFFINANKDVNERIYGGAMTPEFFEWNERVIRGRSEQQLADGTPDSYLW